MTTLEKSILLQNKGIKDVVQSSGIKDVAQISAIKDAVQSSGIKHIAQTSAIKDAFVYQRPVASEIAALKNTLGLATCVNSTQNYHKIFGFQQLFQKEISYMNEISNILKGPFTQFENVYESFNFIQSDFIQNLNVITQTASSIQSSYISQISSVLGSINYNVKTILDNEVAINTSICSNLNNIGKSLHKLVASTYIPNALSDDGIIDNIEYIDDEINNFNNSLSIDYNKIATFFIALLTFIYTVLSYNFTVESAEKEEQYQEQIIKNQEAQIELYKQTIDLLTTINDNMPVKPK